MVSPYLVLKVRTENMSIAVLDEWCGKCKENLPKKTAKDIENDT